MIDVDITSTKKTDDQVWDSSTMGPPIEWDDIQSMQSCIPFFGAIKNPWNDIQINNDVI